MLNTAQTSLKNIQIKSGKYSLHYLNKQNEWKPIEHNVAISMDELNDEAVTAIS